ncbi:VgrG-related protein [Deinococcus sp.]|uniref:VgrG-related protein n=1 Tax=Deinococcus sp. TaxID=47478 RepID=UPI003B5AEDAD
MPSVNLRGSVPNFYIRVGGELATDEMMSLHALSVESSLHMPDMLTLTLRDLTPLTKQAKSYRFIDDKKDKFKNGSDVTVTIAVGDHREENVFDGQVVEVEAHLLQHGQQLVVRAFDRLHTLSRGTFTRTFQNVTDMDLVKKIAQIRGLTPVVGPANFVHDYVIQSNQTDLEFLRDRAAQLGYLLYVDGTKLHCVPMESLGDAGELQWGVNLIEFQPRVSSLDQASNTTLRGWDPQRKQAVVSAEVKGKGEPSVQASGEKDLSAPYTLTHQVVRKEKLADIYAGGSADQKRQKFVEASGIAGGFPKMKAGRTVKLSGVSDRYAGSYTLSAVTHQFHTDSGYTTEFTVSGMRAPDVAQTLAGAHKPKAQYGLVIGIVTNNDDPKNQGRVKLKFPWLSEKDESDWARIATPGGGNKRGMAWIPEVEDEVLVGFEMGDMHHPYVVGGLWNGQDAPPEPTAKLVKGGKTIHRVHYSRKGHKIIMDDSDETPGVTVEDMNGNTIHIDSKKNTLTIQMKGDISVESQGKMEFKAQTGVSIDAGAGSVIVKGLTIELN